MGLSSRLDMERRRWPFYCAALCSGRGEERSMAAQLKIVVEDARKEMDNTNFIGET